MDAPRRKRAAAEGMPNQVARCPAGKDFQLGLPLQGVPCPRTATLIDVLPSLFSRIPAC